MKRRLCSHQRANQGSALKSKCKGGPVSLICTAQERNILEIDHIVTRQHQESIPRTFKGTISVKASPWTHAGTSVMSPNNLALALPLIVAASATTPPLPKTNKRFPGIQLMMKWAQNQDHCNVLLPYQRTHISFIKDLECTFT